MKQAYKITSKRVAQLLGLVLIVSALLGCSGNKGSKLIPIEPPSTGMTAAFGFSAIRQNQAAKEQALANATENLAFSVYGGSFNYTFGDNPQFSINSQLQTGLAINGAWPGAGRRLTPNLFMAKQQATTPVRQAYDDSLTYKVVLDKLSVPGLTAQRHKALGLKLGKTYRNMAQGLFYIGNSRLWHDVNSNKYVYGETIYYHVEQGN